MNQPAPPPITDQDAHERLLRELNHLVAVIEGLDVLARESSKPEVQKRAAELRADYNRRAVEYAVWLRGEIQGATTGLLEKAMNGRLRTK